MIAAGGDHESMLVTTVSFSRASPQADLSVCTPSRASSQASSQLTVAFTVDFAPATVIQASGYKARIRAKIIEGRYCLATIAV